MQGRVPAIAGRRLRLAIEANATRPWTLPFHDHNLNFVVVGLRAIQWRDESDHRQRDGGQQSPRWPRPARRAIYTATPPGV